MPQPKLTAAVHRHASAARAFHTGLVADTYRLGVTVRRLTRHLAVMRHPTTGLLEKLTAAEASCVHLNSLGKLRTTWSETYRDLRHSVRHVRFHLKRLTRGK